MILRIIGGLLILWGFADLGLSYLETDLYYEIGITLSDGIYPFTHWIAMGIGYVIYKLGASGDQY